MSVIDWASLLARAQELDKPLSDEEVTLWSRGLIDGNARMWNVQYVEAVQKAMQGGRDSKDQLYAMLRAEIPVPAFLLPMIAQIISGGSQGRPGLTALDDAVVQERFALYVDHFGMSEVDARRRIASERHVSDRTIKRSLRR